MWDTNISARTDCIHVSFVCTVNIHIFAACLYSDVFPCELQFNIASKYIVDQTQTANMKVRQPTCLSECLSAVLCLCAYCLLLTQPMYC